MVGTISLILSAIVLSLEIVNVIQSVSVYTFIIDETNRSINPRCEENKYLSICRAEGNIPLEKCLVFLLDRILILVVNNKFLVRLIDGQ